MLKTHNYYKMLRTNLLTIAICLSANLLCAQNIREVLEEKIANGNDDNKCELLLQLANININTYPSEAVNQADEAAQLASMSNNVNNFADAIIIKIKILCAKNDFREAEKHLQQLEKVVSRTNDKGLKAKAKLVSADIETAKGELDSAAKIYNELLEECLKSGFYDIAIKSANQTGFIWREKNRPEESHKSFLKAFEIEEHHNFPELKATTLNFLGSHFWRNGQYNNALDYYQQALTIRLQFSNDFDIVNSLINIGNSYQNMGKFDKAVEYQTEALNISNNWENQLPKAQIMNYMGNIYWRKSLYDSSLTYYRKSLNIYTKLHNELKTASLNDNIGNAFKMSSQFDSAMIYYNKALSIRQSMNAKPDIAYSLTNIGSTYWQTAKYPQALEYYFQALEIREEIGNKADIAKSLNNIGLIYKELSDYNKATEYQKEALSIYQSIGNKALTASTLNQIGNAYWSAGNLELALENHMQALRLRQTIGDENATAVSMNNIGLIYRDLGQYDKAISFFNDAIATNRKSGNRQALGLALNNLGDTYDRCRKTDLSINQYNEALSIFEDMNDTRSIAITAQNIGQFYFGIKQYNKAKAFFDRALKLAQEIDDIEIIKNVSYDNFQLYESTKETAKALESFKLYNAYRDSISNSKSLHRMLELQSLYEINVKEKEIALLKSQTEYTTLTIKSQQRQILIISISLIALLILCIAVFISYRNKKRANEMLRKTFSIIAHDLRSPVAAMNSITSMLNQNEVDITENERKELIGHTEQLTASTLQLLETLLEWSHSQNGDIVEYKPENLQIKSIVSQVAEASAIVAKNKNITITNNVTDNHLLAFADRKGVQLILRNLIANAIKFSHKDGEILITAQLENNEVVVSVKDSGIGIAPDDLKRITQGLNSTSRHGTMNEKGFGLGMRFCIDFVHANKGRMWAESEEGKYTIFHFSLPTGK